jgi:hypothetical protein
MGVAQDEPPTFTLRSRRYTMISTHTLEVGGHFVEFVVESDQQRSLNHRGAVKRNNEGVRRSTQGAWRGCGRRIHRKQVENARFSDNAWWTPPALRASRLPNRQAFRLSLGRESILLPSDRAPAFTWGFFSTYV